MTTDTSHRNEARAVKDTADGISLTQKLCFIAPLAVLQVGLYWLLNHCLLFRSREFPLTWIDRATPFWLWTIWGYYALIAMAPGLPLLVRQKRVFYRLLVAYFISMGTAWLFFSLMPTHYPRPPLPPDVSWPGLAYRALVGFDSPECSFPSSHVIVPLLACFALRTDKSLGAWWPLVAASVVICCLSILTTKQHYLWDLIGGMTVAAAGWFVSRLEILAQELAIIVGMKPTGFHFTVILADIDEMAEDLAESLFQAGCNDGSPWSSKGVAAIAFDREAESIEHAVRSAIADVQKAGCQVAGVKIEATDYPLP